MIVVDEVNGIYFNYGFEIGKVLWVELVGDVVWVIDEFIDLCDELLGGIGLEGTTMGPWQTIINFEIGAPVAGPGDGFSARIVFLKLFG